MIAGIAAAAGFALGLYAGKRRANGRSWCSIGQELYEALWRGMQGIYNRIRQTFRAETVSTDPDGRTVA